TFQEYLAACHLTDHEYPDQIAALVQAEPNRWREVALLAGAKAARGSRSALWSLVEALCCTDPEADDEASCWGALIAAELLLEAGDWRQPPKRHVAKIDRLRSWQQALLTSPALPPVERALAGRQLGRLGELDEALLAVDQMPLCYVPCGPFWMGSPEDDELAWADEKPLHKVEHLTEPYWLGQYPVTNAQYARFVAATDQRAPDHWQGGAPPDDLRTHPVVNVSWDDAQAYCAWLSRTEGRTYRLPTEAEWEKGARGGETIPQTPLIIPAGQLTKATLPALLDNELPHRRYPWRSETSPEELTNIKETEIGVTSRPSIFADGISPYGCADMMGNVWEWTRTIWGKTDWEKTRGSARWHVELEYRYPYLADERERLDADLLWTRVVRGSSWFNETRSARCASRFTNFPYDVYFSLGFRIVVSPLSSGP
ncbi:MAG: formylglycine-generating enzyme family protein, partial [Anaerolineales bacterium]|nr:formylglycine-generating enzyme family protein [Anaerolineales bacterium]